MSIPLYIVLQSNFFTLIMNNNMQEELYFVMSDSLLIDLCLASRRRKNLHILLSYFLSLSDISWFIKMGPFLCLGLTCPICRHILFWLATPPPQVREQGDTSPHSPQPLPSPPGRTYDADRNKPAPCRLCLLRWPLTWRQKRQMNYVLYEGHINSAA